MTPHSGLMYADLSCRMTAVIIIESLQSLGPVLSSLVRDCPRVEHGSAGGETTTHTERD